MTFTILQIFILLVCHFVFDFVFQTHKQATGKSSNWIDLLDHTATYSVCWIIPIVFLINNHTGNWHVAHQTLLFITITFIFHTATDYITSRGNKKLWESGRIHDFFVGIGFDQFLHYVQLFLTLYYVLH